MLIFGVVVFFGVISDIDDIIFKICVISWLKWCMIYLMLFKNVFFC